MKIRDLAIVIKVETDEALFDGLVEEVGGYIYRNG